MKPAMRNTPLLAAPVIVFIAIAVAMPAAAQQPIIYPAKGQSAQQQASDMGQCQAWAKQNTGVDPAAMAQQAANQQPASQPHGGRVRGAAGGAIAGDAGKGAAIGAAGGAVGGGMRQRRQEQAQQQQQQATHQQASQELATYNRALSACMTGRGYTIQ